MFDPLAQLDTSQVAAGHRVTFVQHTAWLGWHALYAVAILLVLALVYIVADEIRKGPWADFRNTFRRTVQVMRQEIRK